MKFYHEIRNGLQCARLVNGKECKAPADWFPIYHEEMGPVDVRLCRDHAFEMYKKNSKRI